ncbi:MAG: hypothetical protein PUD99_04925 [Turicibacter sp.]|nr:hypothetical protein [Turicibacter sp.]MDY4815988.1 hypothetical protein [Turicibacter bilis]CUP48601.1 Uncharacterised protein [Turicibacter sanguinis]
MEGLSFVMTIITLSYLSFYQVKYTICSNLFVIGLLGLLAYELGSLIHMRMMGIINSELIGIFLILFSTLWHLLLKTLSIG